MSIEEKVKKIIAEKLSVDLDEVVPEASFVDDLGADSLAADLIYCARFRQARADETIAPGTCLAAAQNSEAAATPRSPRS